MSQRVCETCSHWDPPSPNGGVYVHTYGVCRGINQDHRDGDGFPVVLDTATGRLNGFVATIASFSCALYANPFGADREAGDPQ